MFCSSSARAPTNGPSSTTFEGMALQCVAVDPQHSARIYVGTDDRGVWRSQDGGRTWGPAGSGIAWTDVTAIAVGGEQAGRLDTVYVGTEPSAVYRSTDGRERFLTAGRRCVLTITG